MCSYFLRLPLPSLICLLYPRSPFVRTLSTVNAAKLTPRGASLRTARLDIDIYVYYIFIYIYFPVPRPPLLYFVCHYPIVPCANGIILTLSVAWAHLINLFMNHARTGKREKKMTELESFHRRICLRRFSSSTPCRRWLSRLVGDSLELRVRRAKGRSPNNASSFIASRFIAGQRNGSAENVRPRETEMENGGGRK